MLNVLADGAKKADALIMEGSEQASGVMIEIGARTEGRPSVGVINLGICALEFQHLRKIPVWRRMGTCEWVDTERGNRKTASSAAI